MKSLMKKASIAFALVVIAILAIAVVVGIVIPVFTFCALAGVVRLAGKMGYRAGFEELAVQIEKATR